METYEDLNKYKISGQGQQKRLEVTEMVRTFQVQVRIAFVCCGFSKFHHCLRTITSHVQNHSRVIIKLFALFLILLPVFQSTLKTCKATLN